MKINYPKTKNTNYLWEKLIKAMNAERKVNKKNE
jgi:hypothetical protein